jgi:hypothetical protein
MKIETNNPAVRLLPPRYDRVELVEPFLIVHPFGTHVVPAGFVCDLESVPRLLQWLFPKLGRGALAGIAHDDLYARGTVTRAIADAAYLALLKQFGVSWSERVTKYLALRAFGWAAWNHHRRREEVTTL